MNDDFGFLNDFDREFLKRNGFSIRDIMDAREMQKAWYKEVAKDKNLHFVYTGNPCKKGHFLKFRSGRCVTCDPESFRRLKQWREDAFLYIMRSSSKRWLKVGLSKNPKDRLISLNNEGYGGCTDWRLIQCWTTQSAGATEHLVQMQLQDYKVFGAMYFKEGRYSEASEVFKLTIKKATEILEGILGCGLNVEQSMKQRMMLEVSQQIKMVELQCNTETKKRIKAMC